MVDVRYNEFAPITMDTYYVSVTENLFILILPPRRVLVVLRGTKEPMARLEIKERMDRRGHPDHPVHQVQRSDSLTIPE